jgi:ribonuclease PH
MILKRADGRKNDELRPVSITTGFQEYAEGSALIELGDTKIICAVSIEDRVPAFLKGQDTGWITAEYSMLPRSTKVRTPRGIYPNKVAGRSQEIQRLIGRCLRAVADLNSIGERTIIVDCDVLQADGGTRTAAITGSYVALYQALKKMAKQGIIRDIPLKNAIAATSVGIVDREPLLDLCYSEDFRAAVDFNVVKTDKNAFVEIQGTAEGKPFSRETIDKLLELADKGIQQLFELQKKVTSSMD